jgi:pSer/pThr/pTyr-binding forkhead associated (FHA) protein
MNGEGWFLETVRGREAGRVYALGRGETILGNALDGGPGLDLAHQEGDSPRRMAARQAQLDLSPKGLTVRDLDSPGGTFVNRQRLLPGQSRTLQAGDVIQLGSVQLKVAAGSPAVPLPLGEGARRAGEGPRATSRPVVEKPAPKPSGGPRAAPAGTAGPLNAVFTLATGARCRTWDDFLTIAAQRWPALREELVSGRLAAFLASVGRGEMAPRADAAGTPDERLDNWLSALPTTRPSRPELDVHPEVLKLRATPGGGLMRTSVRITNTGYRLLRTKARIEPAATAWLKLPAELTRAPIVTVDQTDVPLEVQIPEIFTETPAAAIVLESNGGTRRVEVRLERPAAADVIPEPSGPLETQSGLGLGTLIARQPPGMRLIVWSLGALLLRMLVLVSGLVIAPGSGEARPPLRPAVVLFGVFGCLAAIRFALKHGAPGDFPAVGFAGGVLGVLAASLVVAACRTIEPLLGPALSGSAVAVCLVWGLLGLIVAGVSVVAIPPRVEAGEKL